MKTEVFAIVLLSLSFVIGINSIAQDNSHFENKETKIEPNRESMIEVHESVTPMTPEQMMSYLPGHQTHVPYSWETPRHMRALRGKGDWENASEEIVETYAQAANFFNCPIQARNRMYPKYPHKFYSYAYLNMGREYRGVDTAMKNPEYYAYNPDGSLYIAAGRFPYFNFKVAGCRTMWVNEAIRQSREEPKSDVLFIDGHAKANAMAQDNDRFWDYWGNKIGTEYYEEGINLVLSALRDSLADEIIIQGNIWRPNAPDLRLEQVMNYTHMAYFEGWEQGDADLLNKSLSHLQQITESGRMIRFNMHDREPPTRTKPLSLDEMRIKAQNAMPDLWEKLDSKERDELAHTYAYFDVKLAYFLIASAGEHSYFQFAIPARFIETGTDMWRIKQPFPEYDMPLGKPLGRAQKNGNIWTRKFEQLEVVLDVGNGTVEYRK